jgi:hypothetical protein
MVSEGDHAATTHRPRIDRAVSTQRPRSQHTGPALHNTSFPFPPRSYSWYGMETESEIEIESVTGGNPLQPSPESVLGCGFSAYNF